MAETITTTGRRVRAGDVAVRPNGEKYRIRRVGIIGGSGQILFHVDPLNDTASKSSNPRLVIGPDDPIDVIRSEERCPMCQQKFDKDLFPIHGEKGYCVTLGGI